MIAKNNKKIVYPVSSILLPCILGIIGMISKNVPFTIWIQNLLIIFFLYGLLMKLRMTGLRMQSLQQEMGIGAIE